jgi:hypothetical protein
MPTHLRSKLVGAFAVLGATTALADPPNLVADSGFEDPAPVAATSEATIFFGGQSMGPWQVLGSDILLLASEHAEGDGPPLYFNAHSGDAAVDLTGDGNTGLTDGISQVIATTPGQAYDVTFYVGNQTGTGTFGQYYELPSTVDFQVDGGNRYHFTNANVVDNGIQWTQYYTSFVATNTSTTVAFLNGTPVGDNYAGLDDVSISAVPEATTWAMMTFGMFGVGAALRRRAKPIVSPPDLA